MFNYPIFEAPEDIFEGVKTPKKKLKVLNGWVISKFPERLDILKKAFAHDSGLLDFTPESLIPLWNWACEHTVTEVVSDEELDEEMAHLSPISRVIARHEMKKVKFTDQTKSLLRDVGTYLGELLKKEYPKLVWDIELEAKSSIDFGTIVLSGYKNGYSVSLQRVVPGLRWRDEEQGHNPERLHELYLRYCEKASLE